MLKKRQSKQLTKAERREKKKRPKMAVSGRSVFLLRKLRQKRKN